MSTELATEDAAGVFVVVPAYHEGRVIREVVAGLVARYPNVVVVDDGSSDDTAAEAKAGGATVLCHALNRGQGAALQTGIAWALRAGARYVVTFDADGQHAVEDIAALVAPLAAGEVDVTLGSRFLGSASGITRSRRLLLLGAVWFTRVASSIRVTDAHNGLRAFSRAAAAAIEITIDGMAHASEIYDQIRRAGLSYMEVPVHVRYTEYSRAKGQPSRRAIAIAVDYLLSRLFG